ncbi:MAG: SDR family NAD(P)-dependent oxidoreductase, partial [Bacteroidota bacterium]
MDSNRDNRIAVVGMGALFPDANNVDEFWQNILDKKVSIKPLPEEMLESEVFYRPDLLGSISKQDKSTVNIAAYIEGHEYQTTRKYKIPPSVTEHMDENQHAALYTADQALGSNSLKTVGNDRIGVILGNGMVGIAYGNALVRVQFQLVEHFLKKHPEFNKLSAKEQQDIIEYVKANALKDSIPITEDSAPGVLPNIQAARVANVYDFHGPSFTVDAACASALAAIIKGMQGLYLNDYDAVVCGGADMPLRQLGFIYFSALNALSPEGSFPFDKRANGFVMGQGSGTVILKRLDDAVRNNDTIHAVITGYGEGSDGKGKYIAAPSYEWQARTIEKACRMAGYPADTIELLEAHGTATIVGDVVEVDALKSAFSRLGVTGKQFCGLTSVKSNIGHLKSAAGIAGFIKTVLAIQNKTLPPTASFQEINPKLQLEESPFYVLDQAREWHAKKEHPRRANVSAFGFGGADYHLTLEEFREEDYRQRVSVGFTQESTASAPQVSSPQVYAGVTPGAATGADPVISTFSGKSVAELDAEVESFIAKVQERPEITFAEHARLHNHGVAAEKKARLAIIASSLQELESKQSFFVKNREKLQGDLFKAKQIYFKESPPVKPSAVAVMFPGQASQYLNMFRNVYEELDGVRSWYDRTDAYWFSTYGHTVTSLLYPKDSPEDEAFRRLTQTQNVHPGIFITSFALYDLLAKLGLEAGFMIGHSLGEITALAASGKMAFPDALHLVGERGYAFHDAHLPDTGKMISVMGSLDEAKELVRESGLDVVIANINGLQQIIVAGTSSQIEKFKEFLDGKKVNNKILSVSHAFHSPVIEPVAEDFFKKIKKTPFRRSPVKVIMNHAGDYYPNTARTLERIPGLLRDQILNPVNFVRSVQKLYEDGVRLFVEIGPGSILSNMVKEILGDKKVSVVTSNHKKADDLQSLLSLWASLFAEGVSLEQLPLRRAGGATRQKAVPPVEEAEEAGPVQPAAENIRPEPASAGKRETVVYSGLSIGLPGSYKETFRDDNFEQIFAGHNFIERLTDDEKQRLVDLQVTKLVKDERGPSFKLLSSLEEVIQLAGKIGKLDMIADFRVDEKDFENMTTCIAMGVAAGYEALKDAQIPLVREYVKTSTGKMLPTKLALPREMQEETGVIFANGFPMIDPVIREVSRHLSYHLGSRTRRDMMEFYETLIGRVKDHETRKLLTDWYTLYYSRLSDMNGEEETFRFNYNFMYQISAQANNRLASLINAKGPNFQMNAACSSTSNAITIAEDFIRSGRVKRMIIVGADDPTSSTNFPFLGAGFLSTGAATNERDLYRAAIPFDRRRNGMVISAGAVGVVLETKEEVEKRGVVEVCQVMGTHSFNTAKHPSQIDCDQFGHELKRFIARMEREHGLDRNQLAKQMIYLSHETYTPPRGGCSQTEAEALREAFGDTSREVIIGNTKGMTGHTMGAALEDAVAAKSLQYGKVPPVVNLTERDPMFTSLNLSGVGSHSRIYALKMSAGFGSQGHFALLRRSAVGDARIQDEAKYRGWLRSISSDEKAETEHLGRLYVIKDRKTVLRSDPDAVPREKPAPKAPEPTPAEPKEVPFPALAERKSVGPDEIISLISEVTKYPPEMLEPDMEIDADLGISTENQETILRTIVERYGISPVRKKLSDYETIGKLVDAVQREGNGQRPSAGGMEKETITAETLKVFAEVTKYPEDMLELGMEMEADLGIDTVKQATILAMLGEKYRMERDESIQLSNYPTIGHIVDLVYERAGKGMGTQPPSEPVQASPVGSSGSAPLAPSESAAERSTAPRPQSAAPAVARQAVRREAEPAVAAPAPLASTPAGGFDKEEIRAETLKVFSEVTKYPEDMLELGMEMEADLGIDTVKQATILAMLGERYRMERDESIQLSNYPTIGHIVDLMHERAGKATMSPPEAPAAEATPEVPAEPEPGELAPLEDSHLTRHVVVQISEPPGEKDFNLSGKTVWLMGDEESSMKKLASALTEKSASVESFLYPDTISEAEIQKAISDFADGKKVDVILDSTHLGKDLDFGRLSEEETNRVLYRNSTARFVVYKHLAKSLPTRIRILCITSIDGNMGCDPEKLSVPDPSYGSLIGFYKGLRKELPESQVKIIDFSPRALADEFDACANHLITEIESSGTGVEITYPAGHRMVLKIQEREATSDRTLSLTAKDTLLITGGGTGISSRAMLELARRYPIGFIVVDRTPIPEEIESLARLDEAGLEKLRKEIHEELKKEHQRVTPVMVNRKFDAVTKAIEIHRNLERVRSLGRRVEYIATDVRDRKTLGDGLERARKAVGPVTAILHGAGIDRSHLIDQKSVQEFQDVFSVKALGAYNLMALCKDDPLRLVVTFSSISARFGNAAQLDYCAANSFLNYWGATMRQGREDLHSISLMWSGWKDVGIAWRNDFVRERSEELGLNFIEVHEGIAALIREIEQKTDDLQVVLHRGLGGFVEKGLAVTEIGDLPLIDRITRSDADEVRAYRMFSVGRDALIDQHRLGKVPILPAVAYSELAAEYFALRTGKRGQYLLRNLTFENA